MQITAMNRSTRIRSKIRFLEEGHTYEEYNLG